MKYKITVPASTSNLGCGFDTFGLALKLYNEFTIEPSNTYHLQIEGEGKDLPKDENNLFVRVYRECFRVFGGKEVALKVLQKNSIPTSRGLGSSSTAIVGGVLAYQAISGKNLEIEEVFHLTYKFEPHFDNILPAMLGGFVVCANNGSHVDFVKLPFPADLLLVFVVPEFELSTEEARKVIKREVSLEDAVNNIQRASLFLASLFTGMYPTLKEGVKDKLHQPYRANLIPAYHQVVQSGYEAGALAVFLSGAGPTIGSICLENPNKVANAMVEAFKEAGIQAKALILQHDEQGSKCESINT